MAALRLRSALAPDGYLLVQYEQLCTKPTETLGEICRFLSIEAIDLVGAAIGRRQHLIGNQMRLRTFTGLRLDESWRQELKPAEIIECMRITEHVVDALALEYW